jgi:hypothetical protein
MVLTIPILFLPRGKSFVSNMGPTLLAFQEILCPQLGKMVSEDQHKEGEGRVEKSERWP